MADRTTRIEIRWGNVLSFLFVSLATPVPTQSFYTSILTRNSSYFCLGGNCSAYGLHYYQSIGFMTATSGEYVIQSNSSLDTVGYIFNSTVRQTTDVSGALMSDDESGGNGQFLMRISLRAMFNYTLLVTTSLSNITGSFSVSGGGDPPINFFALWLWRLKTDTFAQSFYLLLTDMMFLVAASSASDCSVNLSYAYLLCLCSIVNLHRCPCSVSHHNSFWILLLSGLYSNKTGSGRRALSYSKDELILCVIKWRLGVRFIWRSTLRHAKKDCPDHTLSNIGVRSPKEKTRSFASKDIAVSLGRKCPSESQLIKSFDVAESSQISSVLKIVSATD